MSEKPPKLAKKTKAEILAEYDKLLSRYEDAKQRAENAHSPETQEVLEKTSDLEARNIRGSMAQLQETARVSIEKLADAMAQEAEKLTQMRQANEAAKQKLESTHDVQVAADALETLVADYKNKQLQQEAEAKRAKQELEDELNEKRRQWERTQEEKTYELNRKRQQEEDEFQEKINKRERELNEREASVKAQEEEINQLREKVAGVPEQVDNEVKKREKEIRERLEKEYQAKANSIKQETEAEQRLSELRINNLTEQIKQQQQEIKQLKQEAEKATKRAQDLAVTIIKHPRAVEDQSGALKQQDESGASNKEKQGSGSVGSAVP